MPDRRTDPADASLEFLRLAGEPVRWHLLQELARSDRHVRELTGLVGRPQNLVSYHLGKLRSAGLVVARRSSADGRDAYYTVALDRFSELLAAAGRSLHPGLQLTRATPPTPPQGHWAARRGCCSCAPATAPGPRSPKRWPWPAPRAWSEAFSAGSHPKPVHPYAARVLRERGISFGDRHSKPLSLFVATRFDHVITLCDKVREVCPEFPGQPGRSGQIHWSIPDPAASGGDDRRHPDRLPARRRRTRHQDRLPARGPRRPAGPGRVMTSPDEPPGTVSLAAIVREWGRIGCIGFGGPPAHITLLRELCVQRASGWMTPASSRTRSPPATCCPARPRPSWRSSAPGGCAAAAARWSAGPRSSCPAWS